VRNIVLVHGAWADGSSWAKVIPLLEKAGLNAVAVAEPAHVAGRRRRGDQASNRAPGWPGHSCRPFVRRCRDQRRRQRPEVVGLVYVAAFAPDVGEAVGELGKEFPPAPGGAELRPDAGGFLTMTTKGVLETLPRIFRWRRESFWPPRRADQRRSLRRETGECGVEDEADLVRGRRQ